ncbi:DUF6249 domain-containing protein [Kangiella shandongensis]|uniref:DUF6249 domain-containing protein n=1 Tax=Kangiella shandongensis TaxID=2763258 RepID=UPI001CBCFCA8|nr:DUF6249 domain-containing protein [Kangiella shandongensis]
MTAIVVPVTLFICTTIVLIGFFYLSHKNKRIILDTIQKSIDSGNPLTPELLEQISNVQPPRVKDLRRGIVLLSIGVASFVAGLLFSDPDVSEAFKIIALLPGFIGIGFLIVWKMNRYKD